MQLIRAKGRRLAGVTIKNVCEECGSTDNVYQFSVRDGRKGVSLYLCWPCMVNLEARILKVCRTHIGSGHEE